jgi:hypothetical protein
MIARAGAAAAVPEIYRSEGLRELLARYVPDMTLAEVWTQRGKRGVVAPSFSAQRRHPVGRKGVAGATFQ